jgi:hypothetical protein
LAGRELSVLERPLFSDWFMGTYDTIVSQRVVAFAYRGEQRLVTCRNVQPIIANIQMVELCMRETDFPCYAHFFPMAPYTDPSLLRLFSVLGLVLLAVFTAGLSACPWKFHLRWYCVGLSCIFTVAGILLALYSPRRREKRYLCYCPHLLSAVLSDFDRGTNQEVAEQNIRAKIRRCASLPIPDSQYIEVMEGTEKVALWLLSRGNFLGKRATFFAVTDPARLPPAPPPPVPVGPPVPLAPNPGPPVPPAPPPSQGPPASPAQPLVLGSGPPLMTPPIVASVPQHLRRKGILATWREALTGSLSTRPWGFLKYRA